MKRKFLPASSRFVSSPSNDFSLSHVNRLLAVHLKKQLFRMLVPQNIQKEALKLSSCFGNHK